MRNVATLSAYFRGRQCTAFIGKCTPWSDELAALTDPATGQSYWSELRVWQDTDQNGVADAGELQSLDALGISAISLVGSGNEGESIAGSAVTNRTSYTTSSGAVGEVAAVDLSTDTSGDVITSASGGVTIASTPEGGPTPTTSFVDQSASPQSYTRSGGTLTDQTTGASAGSGLSAVFLTAQGGNITVSATDTTSYWLGGGTGAGTLANGTAWFLCACIPAMTIILALLSLPAARAADARCKGTHSPLARLLCANPSLHEAYSKMNAALNRKLSELPPDARAAFLKGKRNTIDTGYSYCSWSTKAGAPVPRNMAIADCLRDLYQKETKRIEAVCRVDAHRTLADFARDERISPEGVKFYWPQNTIPHDFEIVSGPRAFTLVAPVGVRRFPSSTLPPKINFLGLYGGPGGLTSYAVCEVQSPSGKRWLVTGGPPNGFQYIRVSWKIR